MVHYNFCHSPSSVLVVFSVVLDVVCGYVLLFLLDIKIVNRQNSILSVRLAGDYTTCMGNGCVSGGFDGVLFCAVLFPTR